MAGHPGDTVETLDLWHADLPEFDGPAIEAKYAILHGQKFSAAQEQAWNAVTKIADHFKSADKYVISLPMWNFGIPYKLKQFIDVIVQPGLAFSFSPETGYKGLITGKPVVVVYARGGAYGPGHWHGSLRRAEHVPEAGARLHRLHRNQGNLRRADRWPRATRWKSETRRRPGWQPASD